MAFFSFFSISDDNALMIDQSIDETNTSNIQTSIHNRKIFKRNVVVILTIDRYIDASAHRKYVLLPALHVMHLSNLPVTQRLKMTEIRCNILTRYVR